MCGIAAVISQAGNAAAVDLAPALAAMRSRGPDDATTWRAPCGRVAFGHTRLTIVGGRHARQPVCNEDGSITAIINGEIYDHASWRAQLLARGHRLRTNGDSELIVHLYEEYGDGVLDRLRGHWALALFDQNRQRALIARDRHGIKPLYYAEQNGTLLAASSATALFAMGVAARLDPAVSFVALSLQYPPQGHSLYQGVSVLPAGHAMAMTHSSLQRWRWTEPVAPQLGVCDPKQVADEFSMRFEEAVRLRAQHDGPIAVQLSGGIDSTAVLAQATRMAAGPISAFTVSFPENPAGAGESRDEGENGVDELDKATRSADHLGVSLYPVMATPERLAQSWPQAIAAGQGLAINAHLPAKWLLAEAVSRASIRVVLTGEGADEVLYGYPHLRADSADAAEPTLLSHHAASLGLMLPDGVGLPLAATNARLGFCPAFLRAKACIGARVRPLLRPAFVAAMSFSPDARLLDSLLLDGLGGEPADIAAHAWRQTALEGYILRTLGDGMEMAHGIEGRLPFLDAPLSRWLDGLCWRNKISGMVDKAPLRQALAPLLPPGVAARPKHPFLAPPLTGPLIELAADALTSQSFRSLGIVNVDAALAQLHALPQLAYAQRKQLDPALWLLASLAMLCNHFSLSLG